MLSEWVARQDLGYAGLLMGAEEFHAIGETRERYELVNGVVVMSPSPTPQHWRIIREVLRQIDAFSGPGGVDPYVETDLYIESKMVFRPDLCVYAKAPSKRPPSRLAEAPDLVVEVNSPGNKSYDLVTKREVYERFGVREYWSIDPWDPNEPAGLRVRAWRREGGRLVELPTGSESLRSVAIAGFVLDFTPLRELAGP
ncbi:MAG TPA: Uma2 family endonuclease [Phycisphaerales bacterium]|nr:Uma2 family endonuclease [Phycisphaerales bacterium]